MTSTAVPPKGDATSKATRLLCAGTYLDPVYRKSVIRELLTNRFRVVAPSYGYDAVPVLAHALAAERLRRTQASIVAGGAVVLLVLMYAGLLDPSIGVLLFLWLLWGAAYLRRIATLQALVTRLRPQRGAGGFDGDYPDTSRLTAELVAKIHRQQTADENLVLFGDYTPFVGAGVGVDGWANTELLIGAPVNVLEKRISRPVPDPSEPEGALERKQVKPFTVADITAYVTDHMTRQLRDEAVEGEQIQGLTIERQTYRTANQVPDGASGGASSGTDTAARPEQNREKERDYLCVRVGSWDQELVTSMFVRFDRQGDTLHTEFYTYVLTPIIESFHLVDLLPATVDGPLMRRVAWHVLKGAPGVAFRALGRLLLRLVPRRRSRDRSLRQEETSQFGLDRYAVRAVNTGALTSVREMAMSDDLSLFFQAADRTKYMQIVQRRLLQIIGTFLAENNVDLHEHNAHQTNILNQTIGDKASFGSGNVSYDNQGQLTQGDNSSIGKE